MVEDGWDEDDEGGAFVVVKTVPVDVLCRLLPLALVEGAWLEGVLIVLLLAVPV
jgi:hypothetical protein